MANTATLALPPASQQTVSDILSKGIAQSVGEVVQPTIQELVHEARLFKTNITNYKKTLQDLENTETKIKIQYNKDAQDRADAHIEAIIQSAKKYKDLTKYHNNLYKKLQSSNYMSTILHFQNVLNNFLGQRMVLTLVNNETGTIYFSITEEYDKYLYLSMDKNSGAFVGRFKDDIQTMVNQMQQNNEIIGQVNIDSLIQAETADQTKTALLNVQWAHRSALWRINRSYEVHPKVGVILWHSPGKRMHKWWYGVVANRGIIAEAYAEIIINRQEDVFYTTNHTMVEYLLDIFILEYMSHVTNAAGAVFGDISDLSNHLDYAIKTSKASLKLEEQLITYANIILDNDKDSKETLIKKIEAQKSQDMKGNPIMAQGLDRVFQALGDYAYYEVDQIIKETNKYNATHLQYNRR